MGKREIEITDGANMNAVMDMQGFLNGILKHSNTTTPNEKNSNNILEVKTSLSTLEADFVEFVQDIKNSDRGIKNRQRNRRTQKRCKQIQ